MFIPTPGTPISQTDLDLMFPLFIIAAGAIGYFAERGHASHWVTALLSIAPLFFVEQWFGFWGAAILAVFYIAGMVVAHVLENSA
jgi:hypothetical protein